MKEARYFYVKDAATATELPPEEATHAIRVLRLKEGDEIFLMDGVGTFYHAEVTLTNNKHCMYRIIEALPQERAWKGNIHIAIAPTKNIDRIEWMTEKATEVGFNELSFLNCQFSERRQVKEERIEKIIISAAKQSRKPWMPKLNAMTSFREFIIQKRRGRKFICHCYNEVPREDLFSLLPSTSEDDVTILVGPEGDFSIDEVRMAIENGYESVSLGTSRLRTETAGLMATVQSHLTHRL